MSEELIETKIDKAIAVVSMRNGKVNAMDLRFLQQLNNTLQSLANDDTVRFVIVAGNDRVFSAGVDLKRVVNEGLDYLDEFLPELNKMFLKVFQFPKPLIAAVTGHAIAGGCVLASGADYRVISDQAKIGVPELRVGVPFPASGMEIMRWAANSHSFKQMINTGATFQGDEAVRAGMADESAASNDVIEKAKLAIEPFSVVPPEVFQLTKKQMRLPVMDRIDRCTQQYGQQIDQLWRAPETQAAVKQYVQQRLS